MLLSQMRYPMDTVPVQSSAGVQRIPLVPLMTLATPCASVGAVTMVSTSHVASQHGHLHGGQILSLRGVDVTSTVTVVLLHSALASHTSYEYESLPW